MEREAVRTKVLIAGERATKKTSQAVTTEGDWDFKKALAKDLARERKNTQKKGNVFKRTLQGLRKALG
jgi:hypothetical protein